MKARFKEFIAKLLSLKTIMFAVSTAIFITSEGDKFPWYAWLLTAAMFLGLRYMEKLKGLGGFRK